MSEVTPISPASQRRRKLFLLASASTLAALTVGTVLASIAISHLRDSQPPAAGASPQSATSSPNTAKSFCP